jgi:CHASE3 domain sensor protein
MTQLQQVNSMSDLVDKTHHLELAYLKMSNGARGYFIQPQQEFIALHDNGEAFFEETVEILNQEELSLSYLEQLFTAEQMPEITAFKNDVDALAQMIQSHDDVNEQMISLLQQGQGEAASQLIVQQSSNAIDAEFASLNQNLHQIYQGLVIQGQVATEQSLRQLVRGIVLIAWGLGISAGVALWWMVSRLSKAINRTANQVTQSTHEIMSTVEQQNVTATTQASAVNETTTTMEELERSAEASAEQAQKASQAATQALQLTAQGNEAVQETLSGMQELQSKVEAISTQALRLSEQNQQIGTISQLVSTLSTQTNMLALNAAVEAVRAGEFGKGFSVVASEIRKLADESQKSAERINNLVAEIQTTVNSTVSATQEGTQTVTSGMNLVQDTAKVFAGVQEAVNDVVMSNQQIALNVQQQMQAVQQVVGAMTSLNRGAQETALGTQQTQYEIQQLDQSARNLQAMI